MINPSTTARAGLFTKDAACVPVPLAGVSIEARISSFCAQVVVTHRYVNRETTPIEAVYVFPLDEGAAVCGFEAIIDGTLVIGEVKEREQAFEMYDDAIEQGHGAFLLDEERPDVFQASVGNLLPGKEVLLKLTYVTELAIAGGRLRFTIPTTVSPRYAPAEDRSATGRPDSEALNPPVAWRVPYGLSLSVQLAMPGTIAGIESPSHPIAVTLDGGDATVTLAQAEAALDRDFVLSIDARGLDAPQALVERDDEGREAVAVAFAPRFDTASAPSEVIFVVDRSGSMEGTSIAEVRNALQLCLRSMLPGCRFNIVGFGSTYEALFPESRAYEQHTLTEASEHVSGLRANLGGTEILPALEFVLQQPRPAGLARQVVVLTDGEVTNTDAVLALAAKHAADARIFTFGIGAGASHHLVRGLARAGGGTAEFIYPGERVEPKVLRQFARLLSPGLVDVRVDWHGGAVTQVPAKLPPVFAGDRLLVYGFVKDARPTMLRLSATGASRALSFDVAIEGARVTTGRTVATLAARSRIRELEEGDEWLTARGSRQKGRKAEAAAREIIALSIRYGLISRETSFIAIERRETPVVGEVKLRKVPVALTTGWGGLQDVLLAPTAVPLQMDVPIARASAPSASRRMIAYSKSAIERGQAYLRRVESAPPPSVRRVRSRGTGPAPAGMHALIALQRADGSWDLTHELAVLIGRELRELEAAIANATGSADEIRRAWATALAVAWLQLHASGVEDEWRLLVAKARKWIDAAGAAPEGGSGWVDVALRALVAIPNR